VKAKLSAASRPKHSAPIVGALPINRKGKGKMNRPISVSKGGTPRAHGVISNVVINKQKEVTSIMRPEVTKFFEWLFELLEINDSKKLLLCPFLNSLANIEKTKGTKFLILSIKEIRLVIERYIVGDPIFKGTTQYVRLNSSGLPVILKYAIHGIKERDKV
jgi:hypothetical protein